ncbi:Uncharacterized mitochondrial protein AtMg00310, partial [Linum perenne]
HTSINKKIRWVAWSKLCSPKSEGGLGFRDLHQFNLALLARQGWKIVTDPNSLLARVLKGRYFHDSTFFQAVEGSRPSWGWSSILASRELLIRGLRLQVGSGARILAFRDNWIPDNPPRPPNRIRSSIPWDPSTTVSTFIDNGLWDGLLLNQVFAPVDVSLINSIPLPLEDLPDQFIWQFSDSGAYTVHSGYELVHHNPPRMPVFGPISPMDAGAWNSIWTFPVPPKLQFFIWKCVLGILPTRVALSTRIKDIVRLCPVCAYTEETVSHLLLYCPLAVRFGDLMNIPFQPILSYNFCIVWRRVTQLPPPVGKRIIFFWWRIWKARNQVVFHSKLTLLPGLKAQLEAHIAKSELELDPDDVPHRPPPRQVAPLLTRWRPPARGRFKINVDGAIRRAQGGAIGFVLRDDSGSVLFAGGRSLPHFSDVFTVEAFAVREALRWCIGRSMIHMDIEGDAAMVSNHILNKKLLHPRAGVIIQECKLLLARYPSIRCLSVRREANTSAHNVARQALTMLPLRSQLLNLTSFACSNLH